MRRIVPAVAAAALLAGCTVGSPATPGPAASAPSASSSQTPSTPAATTPLATASTPTGTISAGWATPTPSPSQDTPSAPPAASVNPAESLDAAFAHPEAGGIAAFLRQHADYLPATVVIGEEIVSGSATGPVELNLKNVPPGTTRMYMTIACTTSRQYRMELTRADASTVGASWGDSCGYWGGLNGYTTTPFDPASPPTRFAITVGADTRYSYVLYASPGR